LHDWFEQNARDLPWRRNPTLYRVWISEIMLQQTQVATVIPYYQRFLKSFPTVNKLATADEQTLLGHWEGLGYYRRARSMHAAAKQIAQQHNGRFPASYDDVLALPGIGRYTAGAILSIADDQRLPILEGNTQRVFSRWVAMRGAATASPATKLLWEIAEGMLPRKNSGMFNQAAMELGALVCTPKNPSCDRCPVSRMCRARLAGLQEEIPGKVSRVSYQDRTEFAMVIAGCGGKQKQPKYLLRPLPEGGRWAGLWDFPRTTEASFESVVAATPHLSDLVGVSISPGARLTTIRHAVTKYRISLHVHTADIGDQAGAPTRTWRPGRPWRFVSLSDMAQLPMSVTGRKIAELLACDRQAQLPL
jgi:A/G-specific adenine glycosylase